MPRNTLSLPRLLPFGKREAGLRDGRRSSSALVGSAMSHPAPAARAASSARLSIKTLTRGSPNIPSTGRSIWRCRMARTWSSRDLAGCRYAATCSCAKAGEMCGIEAARRGRHRIGGDRGRAGLLQCGHVALDPRSGASSTSRSEVRAGRSRGVVAASRRRRTGAAAEVAVGGEGLADQRRADDGAVACDQAAVGLGGQRACSEAGERQRIDDARQQREERRA